MNKPIQDSISFCFFAFLDIQVLTHMAADQYCGILPKDGIET